MLVEARVRALCTGSGADVTCVWFLPRIFRIYYFYPDSFAAKTYGDKALWCNQMLRRAAQHVVGRVVALSRDPVAVSVFTGSGGCMLVFDAPSFCHIHAQMEETRA